mgnify:CR=1 FL=1
MKRLDKFRRGYLLNMLISTILVESIIGIILGIFSLIFINSITPLIVLILAGISISALAGVIFTGIQIGNSRAR